MTRIVIIGGGPAGYESALVAAQLGAEVTVVERDGPGGACVLYDCVPSKTFIASSDAMSAVRDAENVGVKGPATEDLRVDAATVYGRVRGLALAQSSDIRSRLLRAGVRLIDGTARFAPDQPALMRHRLEVVDTNGEHDLVEADVVLIATGATPRILPDAQPDGERILTWRQIYDLPDLPERLVVVGSGVTGAEFASGYNELGVPVTLVCSRDRVLPYEDPDAAALLERVFTRRGMEIVKRARARSVRRTDDGVVVQLDDGRVVEGSHCLMTVGSVPNTSGLGLEEAGIELGDGGVVAIDRVSRTNVPGVYAAGDCTGLMMLASVAAMQGRIAMWHALGEAVAPLRLKTVAANVFTHPEIATVGFQQKAVDERTVNAKAVMLPLLTNARAKMSDMRDGFVKLFCRPSTGVVVGGVVVSPYASELIQPIAMAVQNQLTVEAVAHTISVYPSLSGSVTEAALQLMGHDDLD